MSDESTRWSRPSGLQLRLLTLLASKWSERPSSWVDSVLVSPMDDGGMGSLRLAMTEAPSRDRRFGRKVAEHQFTDSDGVAVLASLYVDQDDLPFEMDVWKTDFSPVTDSPKGTSAGGS
jgi:hypothetical protein